MSLQTITTDKNPPAIGPYSSAVVANGFVFASGQIGGHLPDGRLDEGIEAQTTQTLANLRNVLEAAGSALNKVTKCTVYLANFDHFAAMNKVYAETFGDHRPARVCIEVSRLPKNALVEIDAIAVL